jgi:hypothetical protein
LERLPDEALYRPGGAVSQGADGVSLNLLGELPQQVNLFHLGVPLHYNISMDITLKTKQHCSAVDRHPDRHCLMPIRIRIRISMIKRIQPQVLHKLENKEKFFTFIHSNTISQCFSFLIRGKGDTIISIFFRLADPHSFHPDLDPAF